MPKHALVIGGGLAGLAAASTLACRGVSVTLLEAAAQLGGRTRSVSYKGVQLDNGQHIMLGAYSETLKLLAKMGVPEQAAFLRMPLHLELRAGSRSAFKLATASYLPAPMHALLGLLLCTGLTLGERMHVIQFMLTLKSSDYRLANDLQLADFLQQNQQSSNVVSLLWEPLCLAALNTPIKIASSKLFLNVLRDTFKSKDSTDFLLPKHDLSQLFAQPIASYLTTHPANILLSQRVENITPHSNGYTVACNAKTFEASHVIVAISAGRLRQVIGDLPQLSGIAAQADSYAYQPIYTIYLQYPREATLSAPMLGLVGGLGQWVFDRGILCGQSGLMAVVISAAGAHQTLTQDALATRVAQELQAAFPHLAQPVWHKVIAEKRATFSCQVNLPRPAHVTPYPQLYLAGDYTCADYPATIEGAVRSGMACADLVLNS